MAVMAVSRMARAGWRRVLACSWLRISGEAFTRAHEPGVLPVTAIEDWVRARVWRAPLRTPAQLRQLQFHCGNPPPAAEPRTRILTSNRNLRARAPRPEGG